MISVGAKSQTQDQGCKGSLGDPVLTYDFDRGSSPYGTAIPDKTNYNHVDEQPSDGSYTIVKTTAGMGHVGAGNWLSVRNHTPNDPDGYMMLINADDKQAGIFYQDKISGLCPGTTYEFAAWIINVMAKSGIKPNIKFIIESLSGQVLKEFETKEIPEGNNTDWIRYGDTFTTSDEEVIVKIKNNGLGGGGNDFALDDITFRACGPVIIPSINGMPGSDQELCVNIKKDFTFSAEITPGVYNQPRYLWQQDINGTWLDMPGETNEHLIRTFDHLPVGTYKYRVLIAEDGNINSPKCRSSSLPFIINVVDPPKPIADRDSTLCIGGTIHLKAITDGVSYSWTGPNGNLSSERSPSIPFAEIDMSGIYTVNITTAGGCSISEKIDMSVIPLPIAEIAAILPTCKNVPVTLSAKEGGSSYKWIPATGLSADNIRDPLATVSETTTYTVFVSNGFCETSDQVTVFVLKDPLAQAGPDQKIMKGNTAQLNGKVDGDSIRYVWTPANYLDDQFKLNPVATPPSDITYTLNVISKQGCVTATDEMFIRVYKKLVIPNAFSPNADGTNDVWNITAIDLYPNAKVTIVNRYGQPIFESIGYQKPWDGRCQNQEVPTGVYYYIIELSPGLKTLTGSIMVLR